MTDQASVDSWLAEFVERLRVAFGERLLFVGHHGSWARGDATPDSDIDTMVILDDLAPQDLGAYRAVIDAMPDGGRLASGLLNSVAEMRARPRFGLLQYFHGCNVLHGGLDGIVEAPTARDLIEAVRSSAANNLLSARHYLLYPHDLRERVARLRYPFKECVFALQAWLLARQGRYYGRKDELLDALADADDREVLRVVRDWGQLGQDRQARPRYYVELLERWSRSMSERLAAEVEPEGA